MSKIALFLLLAGSCLAALAQQVGRIDLVAGEVTLMDAKAKARSARVGEPVQQGDIVTTGKDGELHATLNDGSVLALRSAARMQIVRFQSRGRRDDTSIVALFSGALRTITGLVGRRNPKHVLLRTPSATIGIRGTDHETFVVTPESGLGEPGTYNKVNAGGTRILSERGSIDVAPAQAGFAPPAASPMLLAGVPEFFKPTVNEKRLEGLNEALQKSRNRWRSKLAPPADGRSGSGTSGTRIQGNTHINASASGVSATAVGSDNEASNRIGTIGGH